MDIDNVFSSSDEQDHRIESLSERNRQCTSTDIERSSKHTQKTKNIKKKYQPIEENGRTYHYEDDPSQYRKIRKKIQNRLSARRVRGRKQDAFDTLQQEVDYLRKVNSELQLSNARLETQNKSLKEQIEFMKGLVKPLNPHTKSEPIEKYLNSEVFMEKDSTSLQGSDFQSPFMEEDSDWLRLPNRRNSSNSWAMLAVFTLVLAVFVLPSDTSNQSPTILFSSEKASQTPQVTKTSGQYIIQIFFLAMNFLKSGLKYFLIFGYIWILYTIGQKYMKRKKMKKV